MSLIYPIFNDDPIFGSKLKKTSCPAKSDICGNLPGVSVLNNYVIPKCNDLNFKFSLNPDESPSGCCVVETSNNTCENYITESLEFDGADHDMGIQFLDSRGINPKKICHSAPIRKRVIKIQEFFVIILISAIVIITAGIIGGCYEFWLKFGTGIYSQSNCKLTYINKCTRKEISPIDYSFPSSIYDYPYTSCSPTSKLEIPYVFINYFNIKDTGDEKMGYKILKILGLPVKSFCLNFLYTLLFSRKAISIILKNFSMSYKKYEGSSVFKNIVFLFLTGILFNVIAHFTKILQLNNGPTFILYLLTMVVVFAMIFTTVITNFALYWFPEYYNHYEPSHRPVLNNNYSLIHNIFYKYPGGLRGMFTILANVLVFLMVLIPLMASFVTGLVGSMVGGLYMIFSLIWNLFYIPLSNTSCFLSIIKDHGDLLTILFCISILVSSIKLFNSATSGTIGGLVGLLIIYKIYVNMK